jgi:hypothetical protein
LSFFFRGGDRWFDFKDSEERRIIGTDVWDIQDPIASIILQELQSGNTLALKSSSEDVLEFFRIDLYFAVRDV